MTYDRKNIISDFIEFNTLSRIFLGDNRIIYAIGEGTVKLLCFDGHNQILLELQKVLLVPELTKNLVSVTAMTNGAEVKFDKNKCVVSKDDRTVTIGHILEGKLYQVNTEEHASIATSTKPNLGT